MSRFLTQDFFHSCYKILILGSHGAAMRAIAQFCIDIGHQVFGFDDSPYEPENLDERLKNVDSFDIFYDLVLYSSAFSQDHHFLQYAREKNIPLCKRSQFITFLSKHYRLIAVTGTHGKTTCSALLQLAFSTEGIKHDFLLGGFSRNAQRQGSGLVKSSLPESEKKPLLLLELDESTPFEGDLEVFVLCILNIKADHLENFDFSAQAYADNMIKLSQRSQVVFTGTKECFELLEKSAVHSFYVSEINALKINESWPFPALNRGVKLSFSMVFSVLRYFYSKLEKDKAMRSLSGFSQRLLSQFQGVSYRFEVFRKTETIIVLRDYGHLPQELYNVFDSINIVYPKRENIIIFQPHKYSRTKIYFHPFVEVLKHYDKIFLLPTYCAGEKEDLGKDHHDLYQALLEKKANVSLLNFSQKEFRVFFEIFFQRLTRPSVIVFQGAGSIKDWAISLSKSQKNKINESDNPA